MSISEPFIRRPVATALLTVGLLLAGIVGYRQLPVSALPQVDYPTIVVSTLLPGASAEAMASAVTTPLERQFGQMPSLSQMTSVSSFGSSQVTLQFELDRSIDAAEQDVQAAINAASNLLPRTLPAPPTYSKSNPADVPILTLAVSSKTLPLDQVNDAADSILAQKISQVFGVGLVTINGAQKPAVRVQVDDVHQGVENNPLAGWANTDRAIILNVQRQPGANVIDTADRVKALLPQLRSTISQAVDITILADRTETVRASVEDVQFTLM